MAITVGTHVSVSGASGGTSSAIDTSGASLLIAALAYDGTGAGNVSDSKGNTWTGLSRYFPVSNDRSVKLFYAENPTVGSGHTFTTTTGISTLCVCAFSGTATASVYDSPQENGAGGSSPIATGNVTPSADNYLLVTGSQNGSLGTQSVDGYFTEVENVNLSAGNYYGCALAYAVQTTATTKQATWTFTNANISASNIAVFKVAGAAPTASLFRVSALAGLGSGGSFFQNPLNAPCFREVRG